VKAEVPHWHPNQLRHTAATRIRQRFDLDAARTAQGHRDPKTSEVYAERDEGRAAEVAREIGRVIMPPRAGRLITGRRSGVRGGSPRSTLISKIPH